MKSIIKNLINNDIKISAEKSITKYDNDNEKDNETKEEYDNEEETNNNKLKGGFINYNASIILYVNFYKEFMQRIRAVLNSKFISNMDITDIIETNITIYRENFINNLSKIEKSDVYFIALDNIENYNLLTLSEGFLSKFKYIYYPYNSAPFSIHKRIKHLQKSVIGYLNFYDVEFSLSDINAKDDIRQSVNKFINTQYGTNTTSKTITSLKFIKYINNIINFPHDIDPQIIKAFNATKITNDKLIKFDICEDIFEIKLCDKILKQITK